MLISETNAVTVSTQGGQHSALIRETPAQLLNPVHQLARDRTETILSRLSKLAISVRDSRQTIFFCICCFLIAIISVHDALLVALNHDVIMSVEENPVGRWLMEIQGGEIWLFLLVKLMGTALASATLVTFYQYRSRMACLSASGVTCFQLGLLCYLAQ